ncbi:hypothetical protein [Shinella sp. JR1-6]|uniref:hypothetical protein n=1 Tax=Shinella sp. JR1-6 TaxID=2527671 RepID=UPI00102D3D61|nr:hypothetical protein [Shinella sp. JR1-6]TAA54065.1 hypothetical protein EXZ48_27520 [Shinella sp. JR1-6]
MSDAIPDDIMKSAREVLADAMGGSYSFDAFAAVFAKAIYAERTSAIERAALVAGDYAGKQSPIAAAIRALSTPTSTIGGDHG